MAKKAYSSLKKQFAAVRIKMRKQSATADGPTYTRLHREWQKLAAAHRTLGFGKLDNLQPPSFTSSKKRSKKR